MNKLLNTMLVILTIISLLALAFVTFLYLEKKENVEPKPLSIDEIVLATVETQEILTNLKSNHYIKIIFKIETDSEKAAEELTNREFQVNNLIIQELSDKTRDELDGKNGMKKLEDSLKIQIDELMEKGSIKNVYITSYIIQ